MSVLIHHKWIRKGLRFNLREFTHPLQEAWQKTGLFWFRNVLKRHFQPNAEVVYSYQKRSRGHNEKKKRLFGHTTPLVFTGALRDQIVASEDVKATSKEAKVKLRGPKYLWYVQGPNAPHKAKEIITITAKEGVEITNEMDTHLQHALDQKNAVSFAGHAET